MLLGDLMLDRYLYGNAERLSPEAPVPVLHYQSEELRLGGAGGVAANLAALGATVRVVGVVGDDENGNQVAKAINRLRRRSRHPDPTSTPAHHLQGAARGPCPAPSSPADDAAGF